MKFGHKLHQDVGVNMGVFNLESDPTGARGTPIYVP